LNRDNISGFSVGLLAGLLIGGVVTLLYTPKSGKETRTLLKDKVDDAGKKLRAVIGKGRISDVKP
jgi:gas vesicle protein